MYMTPLIKLCLQSLEPHTVYRSDPLITWIPNWFSNNLLLGHSKRWIFIRAASKTVAEILRLYHLYGKLKAVSKTCIIGSDTSLTISSLFTHAHYFCLVEQYSSFSSAGGAARDFPLRHHILTSRELIWQHITTATHFANNLVENMWLCSDKVNGHRPGLSRSHTRFCCLSFGHGVNPVHRLTSHVIQHRLCVNNMHCEWALTMMNHFPLFC